MAGAKRAKYLVDAAIRRNLVASEMPMENFVYENDNLKNVRQGKIFFSLLFRLVNF